MIIKNHIIKIIICLLTVQFCYSQNNKIEIRKTFELGEDALEKSDYLKAYYLFLDVIARDTSYYKAKFNAGLCLFSINKTDTACIKYFIASKAKVPEAHYYLGKIYQLQGHSKQALEELYYFKTINSEENITNQEVNQLIKTSETALKEEANKQNLIVRNIGSKINTGYSEYVPLVWSVNGSLVFTSRRSDSKGGLKDPYGRYYEDIYVSQRTPEGWSTPSSLSDDVNTNNHDACVAFSPNGNELIIYRTDEKQTGGDLYLSTYDGTKWSVPQKLGPEINSEYLEASACFSADGNEIIFSSNRPGGFGGKDLYRIRKFMNGKYSLPYNLGPNINTPEDEDAPFIDKNDNTLYFSSKGHNSIGEYDIFKSTYNPDTYQWYNTENLGKPINSTNDDIYFTKIDDVGTAYFSSRRENGYGDADIYEVNLNESSQLIVLCKINTDKITDKADLKDLQLSLYDEDGKLEGVFRPNKSYMTLVLLVTKDKPYKILVEGKGTEPMVLKRTFTDSDSELNIEVMKKVQ